MKNNQQLLNNVIGQLKGISLMLGKEKECFEILTQLKAAKAALNTLTNKFLEENFVKCMNKKKKNTEKLCHQFFSEIIKNN